MDDPTTASVAMDLSAEEALVAAAVQSMTAMQDDLVEPPADPKTKDRAEAAGATPPCVTCGEHCVQCTDPAIVRLKGVKRIDGCTACAGKCPPRVLWVGRRDAVTVHTVGYGAAAGEAWRWHPEVGVWELGLRTLLPTNTKRNRFQWLQRHGHKVARMDNQARPSTKRISPEDALHKLANVSAAKTPKRKAPPLSPALVAASGEAGSELGDGGHDAQNLMSQIVEAAEDGRMREAKRARREAKKSEKQLARDEREMAEEAEDEDKSSRGWCTLEDVSGDSGLDSDDGSLLQMAGGDGFEDGDDDTPRAGPPPPFRKPWDSNKSLEELQALFQYTITEAARRKGVGVSTLQRMCRNHGIDRWPKQRKSTDGDRRQSAGSLGDDGTTDDEEEGGSRGAKAKNSDKDAKGKAKRGDDSPCQSNDTAEFPQAREEGRGKRRRRPVQRADAWDEDEDDLLGTQEQEERAERAAASAASAMEALAAEAAAAKDQMDAEATTSYASRTLNGMSTVNRAKRERHPKGEQREEGICELEQLKPLFRYTVSEAADRYGVGLTHFKTICRRNGIDRWPKRKLDSALQVVRHHKQAGNTAAARKAEAELEAVLNNPTRDLTDGFLNIRQQMFKKIHNDKHRRRKLRARSKTDGDISDDGMSDDSTTPAKKEKEESVEEEPKESAPTPTVWGAKRPRVAVRGLNPEELAAAVGEMLLHPGERELLPPPVAVAVDVAAVTPAPSSAVMAATEATVDETLIHLVLEAPVVATVVAPAPAPSSPLAVAPAMDEPGTPSETPSLLMETLSPPKSASVEPIQQLLVALPRDSTE